MHEHPNMKTVNMSQSLLVQACSNYLVAPSTARTNLTRSDNALMSKNKIYGASATIQEK